MVVVYTLVMLGPEWSIWNPKKENKTLINDKNRHEIIG